MASKYIQKFTVPDAFPDIISNFTTEVLRNQPIDIIDFGIEYFRCLQEGVILDYHGRGNNLPCDFKPSIPRIDKKKEEKYENTDEKSQEIPQHIHQKEDNSLNKQIEPQEEESNINEQQEKQSNTDSKNKEEQNNNNDEKEEEEQNNKSEEEEEQNNNNDEEEEQNNNNDEEEEQNNNNDEEGQEEDQGEEEEKGKKQQ